MPSCSKEEKPLHVVMYTWFAISHLTSFLRLANKLAERGHKVSFFHPPKAQPKLRPHNHHPDLITFIPVPVPRVDGLPLGAETTADVSGLAAFRLMEAFDLTRDTIDSHLARLKPDFVFSDLAYWLPGLARKHGARPLHYFMSSVGLFAYLSDDRPLTEGDLVHPPHGFPCPEITLHPSEARVLAQTARFKLPGGTMSFKERLTTAVRECDAIVVKTCKELEGKYCDYVEKIYGKPVLLAGPMVPEPPASELDEGFDCWLNGFSKGSVVYCALGSECVLHKDQLHELLLGLELSGKPFLAALRPPKEYKTIEDALPEGFLERTKGRGIVHGGWVQQPLILQHSSVGCFVTHAGLGSLAEAFTSECQLVLIPQAIDHFINSRLMSVDLKVGIDVEKREINDNFFTKDAISEAISLVMDSASEVGKEVRANHANLRELLLTQRLEESYMNEFVRRLQGMRE